MNYIRHLNMFFTLIQNDENFTSSHLSLYMALFQYWNYNHFKNPFPIYRDNIMQVSKLAKNTYHKCLRELHEKRYLVYQAATTRFDYARIIMVTLDQEKEVKEAKFLQLSLSFPGRNFETGTVANLTPVGRNFETDTVANLRHNIKPNINKHKSVLHPPTHFSCNKNEIDDEKIQEAAALDEVPISSLRRVTGELKSPTLSEVQLFFQQHNYPIEEAKKFFLYNQGKDWMFTDRIPIKQWKSLAHKWMLSPSLKKEADLSGSPSTSVECGISGGAPLSTWRGAGGEVESLYSQHLSGKNISKLILPRHSDELQLTLTDEILNLAKQRRINQLSGSNERSELDLLHAYTSNENQQLLAKDRSNLISLAKRLATLNHFETLKSQGKTSLFSNEPSTTNHKQ
jgi:hypothetical protein